MVTRDELLHRNDKVGIFHCGLILKVPIVKLLEPVRFDDVDESAKPFLFAVAMISEC